MKKPVTVEIDMKGVNKKLEKIAKEKYPPANVPLEHNERELPYSPSKLWYTPENAMFVPANDNSLYIQPKEDIPFDYHKIKCSHCENVIAIPMGYSNCPRCGKSVYADKNTVFLL